MQLQSMALCSMKKRSWPPYLTMVPSAPLLLESVLFFFFSFFHPWIWPALVSLRPDSASPYELFISAFISAAPIDGSAAYPVSSRVAPFCLAWLLGRESFVADWPSRPWSPLPRFWSSSPPMAFLPYAWSVSLMAIALLCCRHYGLALFCGSAIHSPLHQRGLAPALSTALDAASPSCPSSMPIVTSVHVRSTKSKQKQNISFCIR